ncbi:DUF4232 domain-containing protein [Acetobacter sp. LMG 1637]|uniref:DUF4232 domain-containing protein n=1 Tax=Acetobacter fallax TaxID=1737473 RepID=A0ABX0K5Y5_9PROT|nr:DUF4232 domain-containing protein [Acetobacter fallax]
MQEQQQSAGHRFHGPAILIRQPATCSVLSPAQGRMWCPDHDRVRPVTTILVRFAVALALGTVVSPLFGAETAPVREYQYPGCTAADLSLSFDDENGAFNGMSQSGTLLVLRNISASPCTVQTLPHLHFEDSSGHFVPAERRPSPGMHPGPVMLPVAIAPEPELTTRLHWVASDAYDAGNCVTPDLLVLDIPPGDLHQHFARQMCAPANSTQVFDQAPLRSDPALPKMAEQKP